MPKPVHPAAVHFPIAFLSLSFGLDVIYQLSQGNHLPPNAISFLPNSTDLSRMSYFLLSAGLVSAVPALVTGIKEAIALISKQGMWESDQNGTNTRMRSKVKAMIVHALSNDIVMATSTYIWYKKRSNAANSLAGKIGVPVGAAAYQPEFWMVATEVPIMLLMFMAANIGGILVYNFGIGLSVGGGSGKKTK